MALLVTLAESPLQPARVHIQTVNGQEVEHSKWDGSVKIELLPGPHVIKADFISNRDLNYYSRESIEIRIDAMPGHVYQVDTKDIGMSCQAFVRDITDRY